MSVLEQVSESAAGAHAHFSVVLTGMQSYRALAQAQGLGNPQIQLSSDDTLVKPVAEQSQEQSPKQLM